jgi:hypothetical protein
MKKPKKKIAEIELVKPATPELLTEKAIREDPDFVFEPWFRSRRVSYQIRALKSVPERCVWDVVFKKWGCMICQTKEKSHGSLGMCQRCHRIIWQRLRAALRPHLEVGEPQTFTFDNEEAARKALGEAFRALVAAATEDEDEKP